jgi:hypothetical protein
MQSLTEKGWSALMCKFSVSSASPQEWMFLGIAHTWPVLACLVSILENV